MFFESIALNAAVIIVLIVALSLDYLTKFFSYWYVRHVPYARPVPALGSDLRRVLGLADAADVAADLYRRHPGRAFVGYFKSRIPDLVVRDPDAIGLILEDDFGHFRNRGLALSDSTDRATRDNLFYAEDELWSVLRSRMRGFFEAEAEPLRLRGALPGTPQECDVRELTEALVTRLLCDRVFGEASKDRSDEALLSRFAERLRSRSYASRLKNYLMSIFPSIYVLLSVAKIDEGLVQPLKEMIARAAETAGEGTLVHYLRRQMAAGPMDVTPEGRVRKPRPRTRPFDEDVAAAQVVSFAAEGLVPCGAAAAMALYELARSPAAQAQVQRELDGGEEGALAAVVDEVLRLHPAHSVLHRVCVSTYRVPNTEMVIDKGVTVTIPVAAIHRDAAYYERPDAFDPGRFRSEAAQKRHPYTYLPFGAGPRSCIGQRLARRWVCSAVAAVLRTHTVSPCARTPPALRPARAAFTAALDRPVWLTVTPRHSR